MDLNPPYCHVYFEFYKIFKRLTVIQCMRNATKVFSQAEIFIVVNCNNVMIAIPMLVSAYGN